MAFCCNWCSYAGADLAGTNRLNYPADVKIIRVPCSCRVNPMFILRAFQRGADGVILCGCHPGDCHYTSGNYYARRRMTLLFSMLDYLGIEQERTRVEWVSAAEGAKFAATMNEFVADRYRAGREQETGGSEMQEMMLARAKELLQSGDRRTAFSAGRPGEFVYDVTPAVFDNGGGAGARVRVQRLLRQQPFQISGQGIPQGGQGAGRSSSPATPTALISSCKEHRIARENVYVIGVPCEGKTDGETLKALGLKGILGVKDAGDSFTVETLYGEKTVSKQEALPERCRSCKSQKHDGV